MTPEIEKRIHAKLNDIEREDAVSIPFACESGSRAWGFASADSDYDVRFIYLRSKDWYLSIDLESKRDVIERPILDVLDVNGWDLRKALRLLRKSNPPLMEWLGSPIIYRDQSALAEQLRDLAKTYHAPAACAYHYLHMARGNFREYLKGDRVWRKKYFYVLRPLLAIRWIEAGRGLVPTEFQSLLDVCDCDQSLMAAIASLIEEKQRGAETDRGPRIPAIGDFIEREIQRLEHTRFDRMPKLPPVEPFNRVFRSMLESGGLDSV